MPIFLLSVAVATVYASLIKLYTGGLKKVRIFLLSVAATVYASNNIIIMKYLNDYIHEINL